MLMRHTLRVAMWSPSSGIGTLYRLLLFLSSATKTGTTMAKMSQDSKEVAQESIHPVDDATGS